VATYGEQRRGLISFAADLELETLFGRMPPLKTPQARAAGFSHDGNVVTLIRNALNPAPYRPLPLNGDTPHVTAHPA
jgi:hypothetical protein